MAKPKRYSLSDFHLRAIGGWGTAGEVQIRYQGVPLGSLSLGRAQWSVLAVLIDAAIEAQGGDPLEACRTKDQIADTLVVYANWRRPDPEYVKGYLHGLRANLDSFLRSRLGTSPDPAGWGFFLVPTHGNLGYHAAVPPENLQLTILRSRRPPDRGNRPATEIEQDSNPLRIGRPSGPG